MRILHALVEFAQAFWRRLRLQGPVATYQWLTTVGTAWLTGRVSLRFSRVTPRVYLGPQYGRFGKRSLARAGVTASISMRAEFDDSLRGLEMTDYSYLPTLDNTAPSIEHLKEGVAFIEGIIAREGVVYVHCGSGVGRAPTMVAAYLIAQGQTTDEAIDHIQSVRPFIRILPSQVERLREFEAEVG